MDRYLAVQHIGDGLIALALLVGGLYIIYENEAVGVGIMIGFLLIGSVLSWIGQVRKDH